MRPAWQGLPAGAQPTFATQVVQVPPLQTWFGPQLAPFASCSDESTQRGAPVEHSTSPALQPPSMTQAVLAAHGTQLPALQTRSWPQLNPFGRNEPTSTHVGA